jgi:ADP-ribosylglycohydrolase
MRSAPFGLIPHIPTESVYKLSTDAASLTHGHPSARQSAGVFSLLIHSLIQGHSLPEAAQAGIRRVEADAEAAPELRERLAAALRLAGAADDADDAGTGARPVLSPEDLVSELGEGWVAEEALAVGLYAVLATAPGASVAGSYADSAAGQPAAGPVEHYKAAIALAINHSGDSDSTGSIAGNILGAHYGEECLPADWLDALEAPEVIRGMAGQLVSVTTA